jgi:hypothetical protein
MARCSGRVGSGPVRESFDNAACISPARTAQYPVGETRLAEQAFARQRELMQKQTGERLPEPEITGPKR